MTLLDDRWDNNLRVTWLDTERREFRDGTWEASTAAEKLGVYYQSTLSFEPAAQTLVLAVDYEDEAFTQRLIKVGFNVKVESVRSLSAKRGSRHTIWVGVRGEV